MMVNEPGLVPNHETHAGGDVATHGRGRTQEVCSHVCLALCCGMGAVIGITASIYFFTSGPVEVGWTLAVLTVLLLPANLLVR